MTGKVSHQDHQDTQCAAWRSARAERRPRPPCLHWPTTWRGGFLEWCPVRPFSSNCARFRQSYPSMPACFMASHPRIAGGTMQGAADLVRDKRSQARRSAARGQCHPTRTGSPPKSVLELTESTPAERRVGWQKQPVTRGGWRTIGWKKESPGQSP